MFKQLQQDWHQLRTYPPGQRFRRRFEARRREPQRVRSWGHWLGLGVTIMILIAIGIVLTVLPGPAILFFLLAAALIAGESRSMAWLLDWVELAARAGLRRAAAWWRSRRSLERLAAALAGGLVLGAGGFLGYQLFQ